MHSIENFNRKQFLMFNSNNKKKESNNKKTGIIPSPTSHSLNSLVHGTTVEGTVKSESDIRVDGIIKGSLHCNAKVIIGPTGYIEGEVMCTNAVIEGKFEGNLQVKELLNVRETARISGDVQTDKLIVQTGAVFNVDCKMGAGVRNAQSSSNGAPASPKSAQTIVQTKAKQAIR